MIPPQPPAATQSADEKETWPRSARAAYERSVRGPSEPGAEVNPMPDFLAHYQEGARQLFAKIIPNLQSMEFIGNSMIPVYAESLRRAERSRDVAQGHVDQGHQWYQEQLDNALQDVAQYRAIIQVWQALRDGAHQILSGMGVNV